MSSLANFNAELHTFQLERQRSTRPRHLVAANFFGKCFCQCRRTAKLFWVCAIRLHKSIPIAPPRPTRRFGDPQARGLSRPLPPTAAGKAAKKAPRAQKRK